MWSHQGRALQVEGVAGPKALRWELAAPIFSAEGWQEEKKSGALGPSAVCSHLILHMLRDRKHMLGQNHGEGPEPWRTSLDWAPQEPTGLL